tara:strand:- start:1345 stop:1842 length:498 start_codon:yes stop_codon:yes gene_type:complete
MSETLVTGIIIFLVILVRGFQFWKRSGHDIGELKEVVSTMEASHKTNKNVFGSEPLHVRSVINSKEETWTLKSSNDVMKILESQYPCKGIIYFEDSNEEGIHLVYTTIEENNNAIMNISAKNGSAIIEEGEFNMDHEAPTGVFQIINTLLRERTKKEELDDLFKN